MKIFAIFAALILSVALSASAKEPLNLVLVGDSTMCNYPTNTLQRGWGQFIQAYFDDGVQVINLAKSGRSTKTFLKEGLWQKALDAKPSIVLIQFGHNDSHAPTKPEATDANTDYKTNLCRYIDEARAAGATPILITSMVRRTFGADGKLQDELQRYADAMKQVGAEKSVPVIDLHASSKALVQSLGEAESAKMANKAGDQTHFNAAGAKAMAELVMKELPTVEPALKSHLKP
ncbi:MAG TPA: rhamnogalacturonan acetylesterase [Verrucomicrobiae bacterium]